MIFINRYLTYIKLGKYRLCYNRGIISNKISISIDVNKDIWKQGKFEWFTVLPILQ